MTTPLIDKRLHPELRGSLGELEQKSKANVIAVSVYDLETGTTIRHHPARWFHAASTIKLAVLLGVYDAIDRGKLTPDSRVPVRNEFKSAHDGSPYKVAAERDADSEVQDAIGKTMRLHDLARNMIIRSSNLATNLLLDLLGIDAVKAVLERYQITGIDLRRGVEDELAFGHGINNRVTADGLVQLLRLIAEERAFTPELSRDMLAILHDQEFRSGIPAGLPPTARVAHKTGEISTVAHDAGIVYMPNRKPYVVAILTEWDKDVSGRKTTIAAASFQVYHYLTDDD